ncbi:hypothetical protein [Streptomyces sp. URMC 125]|uniref:hypothetical protein n=1 Tax=Streptomyces sp. URMC 125 TaxID=3423419 RepID=UPI003F1BAC54
MSIAVQRRRPGGRRQPIADAAVAAVLAVGGLVLAGAATADPAPGAGPVSSGPLPSGPQKAAGGPDGHAVRTAP